MNENKPRFDGLPLFSLTRTEGNEYDEMVECIVAAENDLKARMLAQSEGGAETEVGRYNAKLWLTSALSNCEMIAERSIFHVPTMVCRDICESG